MNRQIKFRGKSIETQAWVYGYYYAAEKDGVLFHFIIDNAGKSHEVYYHTVGQFTGLMDKHGVEIYKGDICSTDLSRPYLIVLFRNGAFMYQCHDDGKNYFDIMLPIEAETDICKHTEVISNVHDNPNLIGGRQDD